MKTRISVFLSCILLAGIAAYAHNGMEHVMGTVKSISISASSITVQTASKPPKTVTIVLLAATKYVKDGAPASLKDLNVGDRVVVEAIPKGKDRLEADTVTFGKPAHALGGAHGQAHGS